MKQNQVEQRQVWNVLGLIFDQVDLADSVEQINEAADKQKQCFFSTPNLNFVVAAGSNDTFYHSVIESDLSLADGMPIVWIAKLLGIPIKERVAGSTLFEALSAQKTVENKIKVFFFGGQEGIAEQAHNKLNQSDSALMSCGFYDPGFLDIEEMSQQHIIDKINADAPDFILVALGAVKGQQWILRNKDKLSAPVISHLGAVINFVAGSVKRAPVFWQRLGIEWLWRIKQEPALWKRYFFDGVKFISLLLFKVLPLALYDRYLKRLSLYSLPVEFDRIDDKKSLHYRLAGSVCVDQLDLLKLKFQQLLSEGGNKVYIDFSDVSYIDAAAIAQLMLLQHQLHNAGSELLLLNVSTRVKAILYLNHVKQRFKIHKIER